ASLTAEGVIDLDLERMLLWALFWADRGDEALYRASSLAERAAAAGDDVSRLCAELMRGTMRLGDDGPGCLEDLLPQALPVLERAGANLALYVAHTARGQVAQIHGQMDAALSAYELAVEHAGRAGLPDLELAWRSAFMLFGTTPVQRLLAWLDRHEHEDPLNHWLQARRGIALAWLGRFDEARAILDAIRTALEERQARMKLAFMYADAAWVERLAADHSAAVEHATQACALLEAIGTPNPDLEAERARALCVAGHHAEAELALARAGELTVKGDIVPRFIALQVRAKLSSHRGDHTAAEQLARDAVALAESTDMLEAQGDVLTTLAEILIPGGRPDEARAVLELAFDRYARKGILVSAERTREALASLGA
ncbi:MAG: hypothetical protein ACRC50_09380, partial [Gaiella sp.]